MPPEAEPRDPARSPTPILFAHWGHDGIRGSERVLLDLLARIDRREFAPLLWCNAEGTAAAARALDVRTHVSAMPILLGWDDPRFDVRGFRRLVHEGGRLIAEHRIRLVHVNSGAPSQWMIPAARRAAIPLLTHLHAIYNLRDRCTLLLHQAPLIVGCSDAVVAPFRGDGVPADRLRVVHNGVDAARLARGDASRLRAELGVAPDDVFVVAIGALVPLKGFDTLVRALADLRDRGLAPHLAILGDGPERERLERLATELGVAARVHLLGQRNDVGAVLRDAADLLAVASHVESFGLVIAEAATFGKPSVATAVGGIPEVVRDRETGLLVPLGDRAALADALARVVTDGRLRERLGDAARAWAREAFSSAATTRAFEELYQSQLARPARAFGWRGAGVRVGPCVRYGLGMLGRRLGVVRAG